MKRKKEEEKENEEKKQEDQKENEEKSKKEKYMEEVSGPLESRSITEIGCHRGRERELKQRKRRQRGR